MPKFDIKNPNGSQIFVGGIKVRPYSNFSADLDPLTVLELRKFGVYVKPVLSDTTAVVTPSVLVSAPVVHSPVVVAHNPPPPPPPPIEESIEADEPEPVAESTTFVCAEDTATLAEETAATVVPAIEETAILVEEPVADTFSELVVEMSPEEAREERRRRKRNRVA